jgi:5-methylcytosine-specific restriction endonuclease McrA
MGTTEEECLAALREAAQRLGESPTKAAYDDLDITPSSTTITRIVGSWNEAKERAGLDTYEPGEFGGTEVRPKPADVEIPEDQEWEELTAQQRWYYKNREHRIRIKETRRNELKRWFYELKRDEFCCLRCGEDRSPALDFHHEEKTGREVAEMVNDGFSKERITQELERCIVLCANCHRKEHHDGDDPETVPSRERLEARIDRVSKHEARNLRRQWTLAHKRESGGCERCRVSDPVCLDFHHTGEKTREVSHLISFGRSLSEIRREIERCRILCANCHRVEHFEPPEPLD